MRLLPLLLAWSITGPASAADLVINGPTEPIEVREDAQLIVDGLTEEMIPAAVVNWWPKERVKLWPCKMWGGPHFLLFEAAKPGTYMVEVFVCGPSGPLHAECVVVVGEGDDDDPPPPPPPPPNPDKVEVILLYETAASTLTTAQVSLMDKLVQELDRRSIVWHRVDKDKINAATGESPSFLKPYLTASQNQTLPVLAVGALRQDGAFSGVLGVDPLPGRYEEAIALVDGYVKGGAR